MILGALIGDFIGSLYEFRGIKGRNLPILTPKNKVTDESLLIYATDLALNSNKDYVSQYLYVIQEYPDVGYGQRLLDWSHSQDEFYTDSYGNGSSTRAIPIANYSKSLDEALMEAEKSAICTHDEPYAILCTKAVVETLFRLKQGENADAVKECISSKYFPLDIVLEDKTKDEEGFQECSSAIATVPVAIQIGLNSRSFIDAVRTCLYMGGDVDSIMCIACSIASMRHPVLLDTEDETVKKALSNHIHINYPEMYLFYKKLFV